VGRKRASVLCRGTTMPYPGARKSWSSIRAHIARKRWWWQYSFHFAHAPDVPHELAPLIDAIPAHPPGRIVMTRSEEKIKRAGGPVPSIQTNQFGAVQIAVWLSVIGQASVSTCAKRRVPTREQKRAHGSAGLVPVDPHRVISLPEFKVVQLPTTPRSLRSFTSCAKSHASQNTVCCWSARRSAGCRRARAPSASRRASYDYPAEGGSADMVTTDRRLRPHDPAMPSGSYESGGPGDALPSSPTWGTRCSDDGAHKHRRPATP
jgi:hypothetical protein